VRQNCCNCTRSTQNYSFMLSNECVHGLAILSYRQLQNLYCVAMEHARILVADDHMVIRTHVRLLLESRPEWKVCGEAANGQEAVEKVKELHPDLIVLDISMPVLDGIGAAKIIRTIAPEVPILILTMHESQHMLQHVQRLGVKGYVPKTELSQ